MDAWGVGSYEDTAAELAPVADVAIAALGTVAGQRVLDVACGTGNAALAARRAAALVSGVDSSPRLLGVARARVPDAEFVLGDAAELPFEDGSFDAAVSVFGVIFARPAASAAAELARVVRPGGRVVVTSWPPRGPMFGAVALMRAALARVPEPDGSRALDWGDPAALATLLGPYGAVDVTERQLAHRPASPEELWDRWERLHPMWIGARGRLEPAGEWEPLRAAAIASLRDGGMRAGAAGVASPYLLAILQRR